MWLITEILSIEKNQPFLFYTSALFYLILIILILNNHFKYLLINIFTPPKPSSKAYIPSLDVLRGGAALWVACFHVWQWSIPYNNAMSNPIVVQGFKGVSIFCVLSGFLVYGTLHNRLENNIWNNLYQYGVRRFLRIYPLFFVTEFCALMFLYQGPVSFYKVFNEAFMLRTFGYKGFTNPTAWSLYTEVLFYITLPIWVLVIRKRALLCSLIALFFALICSAAPVPREWHLIKYFLMGIVAYEISHNWQQKQSKWALIYLLAGIFFIIFDITFHFDFYLFIINKVFSLLNISFYVSENTLPVGYRGINLGVGFSLLLIGIELNPSLSSPLNIFPIRFVGIISYSIYLWHSIIIAFNNNISFDGTGSIIKGIAVNTSGGGIFTLLFIYIPNIIFISSISYLLFEKSSKLIRPFLMRPAIPN